MIQVNKQLCTGCTACFNVCPHQAIRMEYDEEGFLFPTINTEQCIDCKQCEHVCPIHNHKKHPLPDVAYAASNKDLIDRSKSSSGAIFPIIARIIMDRDGVVFGATMTREFEIKHIGITQKSEIDLLRYSKYVQSNLGSVYSQTKKYLLQGRPVLFTGTGCQVAGLKNFLGKEYDNLYAIDILCRGVPSPLLFRSYIKWLKGKYEFDEIRFRDQQFGWRLSSPVSLYANGKLVLAEDFDYNLFIKTFVSHFSLRNCCYSCEYATQNRVGDFSLGDFWSIDKYDPELNDHKGLSFLLVNSQKGKSLLPGIKEQCSLFKGFVLSEMKASQGGTQGPAKNSRLRRPLFQQFASMHKKFPEQWMIRNCYKVGILNFYNAKNYGAVLVGFAMVRVLEKLGYKPELINYRSSTNNPFQEFRDKYLPQSKPCRTAADFEALNNQYRIFVVGSDQVWRMWKTDLFMFNFVHGLKNILSYAASFATTTYQGQIEPDDAKRLLKRFDSIAVREKSGVDICRDTFDLPATMTADPTLLLEADVYNEIIDNFGRKLRPPSKEYIFIYYTPALNILTTMEKDEEVQQLLENTTQYVAKTGMAVEAWLFMLKNAKYTIVNSYHGTLFSIIFRKQFVVLSNTVDDDRISGILDLLGLRDRLLTDKSKLTMDIFTKPIDYSRVIPLLDQYRTDSLNYLKEALEKPLSHKEKLLELSLEIPEKPISDVAKNDVGKTVQQAVGNSEKPEAVGPSVRNKARAADAAGIKILEKLKRINPARVDLRNQGNEENQIEFLRISDPFVRSRSSDKIGATGAGRLYMLESKFGSLCVTFKCIGKGNLEIFLRGKDERNAAGKKIPVWVTYLSMQINNETIFNSPKTVWHNEPFRFNRKVEDGEIVKLHVEWEV